MILSHNYYPYENVMLQTMEVKWLKLQIMVKEYLKPTLKAFA